MGLKTYLRAYSGSLQKLTEIIRGADLVFRHLVPGEKPDKTLEAMERMVHTRGNLVLSGRFYLLAQAYPKLAQWGGVLDLIAPVPPVLEGHTPPATAHQIVLVGWKSPDHIHQVQGSHWGPRYLGDTTVLPASPEDSPLGPKTAEAMEQLLLEMTPGGFPPLPVEALAALVERYSEPGGLVVDLGHPPGGMALTALILGRRAAVLASTEEEAEKLRALPAAYEKTLERKAKRGQDGASAPAPEQGTWPPRR